MADARYGRVLLKISGEALMGDEAYGIDPVTVSRIAAQIKASSDLGTQIAVVVGGGNIWRGAAASVSGMDRATADYAGMLATMINALALQDAIEQAGGDVRTQTAIPVQQVATDTAAALRAIEIDAEVLLMTKNRVDGVYEADPRTEPGARRFETLTYMDAISRRLAVMDSTALSLCMENNLPIVVFDVASPDGIIRAVRGEQIGTRVATGDSVLSAATRAPV